ncbi:amino acid adenylation domain-containing protein [Leptolyngbya sp. CCNP1308]|uniref:non-ribosomal peptide synthetase n=1 Tax=Leptolyngbya sp. CCNP1308 TaxID=3110255 RepID=UPI002B1ED9B9|nr:non-ribosomal peptide synthetase [Leptolyngbya sp. CCNP1308]MEA5452797.1 amino acid adenylation domain-containing protein [Leptolyngbya sp. CCNP1308]
MQTTQTQTSPAIAGYRLSPQQQRLWRLQQRYPNQPFRAVLRLRSQVPLHGDRLQAALQALIDRHEILRTTFPTLPGMTMPLQVIAETLPVEAVLTSHDWSAVSPEETAAKLNHLLNQPFDWAQGPLLRSHWLRHTTHDELLISLPTLCADGATLALIAQDLRRFYADNSQADDEPPLQYADLAEWQTELLEGEDTAAGRSYWRRSSDLEQIVQRLPLEENRPSKEASPTPQWDAQIAFDPQVATVTLPHELAATLYRWAAQQGMTTEDVCLALWQILIGRLTEQSTLTLGYSCNARQHYPELQTAAGLLTRDLPLRAVLSPEQSFAATVAQVHEALNDIQPWQDYFDWEQVQGQAGWFPISFGVEAAPTALSPFAVTATIAYLEPSTLKLVCRPGPDALTLDWCYDASRLELSAIQQMQGHWQTLLAAALAKPEGAIAQLPLLTLAERQALLVDFNQTTTDPPPYPSLHQWFEAQVAQTPDRPALWFEEECLTYRQLNHRANQLAQNLRQQGVGPESVVAVLLPRSLDWVVALLGILKAGGAYLPLDPHQPADRIQPLCQDAAVAQVVTQREWGDSLPAALPRLYLDQEGDAAEVENPAATTTLDHLAYVIYTSGSTGQPKGVAVEHRHILNYVQGILPRLGLGGGAHFGLVSSVAADLGNTMLFAALCTGGCLHLIAEDRTLQASALADYCRRHPLDYLKIVPSHLGALLSDESAADWLPRQCLVLGGEAAPGSLVAAVRRHVPHCRILNHYGPTETTVGVLTYAIPEHEDPGSGCLDATASLPLGQPLPNVQVYVLDAYQQPVPVDVPGELYVGGAAVSRGYLNQPGLSAERFIVNPFGAGRLYRTGDRVRHLPSGNLEFLGRTDDQIKLRGFRIELGEIAAVLQQHQAVQQAICLLREDAPEPPRLVAYALAPHASPEELRDYLATRLPDYMVPAAIVPLRTFPLTANGKVDRQALPAPSRQAASVVGATTEAEQTLVTIWQELLGIEAVGIHDNFFELGGDSILSIQVIARANQAGLQLTPRQLFEHQTIAALAAVAGTASSVIAEQEPIRGAAPLTPIQHRFFEQAICSGQGFPSERFTNANVNRHHWNQAILLTAREPLDPALLERALNHLVQHHDALRLRFQPEANSWQAVHADDAPLVLSIIDGQTWAEDELETQIAAHGEALQTSLNITTGPLMGAAWFDLGPSRPARLLLVIHHLVVDGVSWRILLEDLQTVYRQLQQQEPVALPPKTTAFQQWGEYLETYSRSAELGLRSPDWQHFNSAAATLPLDFLNGLNTIASAQTLTLSLGAEETEALLRQVPQAYQSQINDVLLTALVQGLAPWTGRSSLLLELEHHGRDDFEGVLDLSRTVGWFTAIAPVQLALPSAESPGAALMAVKEQLRRPGRPLDYGVWRYLSPDGASCPEPCQPALMFNYLGQFDSSLPEASLFGLAPESLGHSRDPQAPRRHLLEINGRVLGGQLRLDWTYSDQCHRRETIAQVAAQTMAALRSLIAHCTSPEVGGYTPSDFPQANLNQAALNQVLAQLRTSGEV